MHIFFIEILLLQTLKTFGLSNECPPHYIKIGAENQWCTISKSVPEGYISYGAAGRWILIPFTNKDGTNDLDVYCNGWFGEPWPFVGEVHKGKYCCFKSTKTAFGSIQNFEHDYPENVEWPHTNFFGTTRFGLNNKYFYTVTQDVNVWCNRETFGANNKQISNKCNIKIGANPTGDHWTLCGSASNSGSIEQFCTGLTEGGTHWLRYGKDDKYYYKLVTSNTQYPCHYSAFNGNNIEARYFPGGSALCWRSPVQYSFGIVGEWRQVTTCVGCQPLEYEVSIGISKTTENERTEEWYWSLTSTMSASTSFKGIDASVELSATVSQTVTNRVMHAITEEKVKTVKIKCLKDKQTLYQWVTTVTEENGLTSTTFRIDGDIYRCQNVDPLCPPEYCNNADDCQSCTQQGVKLASSPVVDNPETPDQIKNITDIRIHLTWIYGICAIVLLLVVANFVMMLYSYSNCCGYIKKIKVATYDEDVKSIP